MQHVDQLSCGTDIQEILKVLSSSSNHISTSFALIFSLLSFRVERVERSRDILHIIDIEEGVIVLGPV
jgi:hypothetical protein